MLDQFHENLHPYISNNIDAVAILLGMGEDSWPLRCDEYATIFGGYDRFQKIKKSLLVDHVLMAGVMKQNINFSPLRSELPIDSTVHRIICIGHVLVKDCCPILGPDVLWSTYCHPSKKQRVTPYVVQIQQFSWLIGVTCDYVHLGDD
ncbi:hypothetical protein GmHk_03G007022 [Glycine max]|nr:hypothetical protein GmHk_03G007022 [Glycine max]